MTQVISVALAGNPNSGKTTLFNRITGSHHHVGNWPGKTVERRSGTVHHRDATVEVVDLPGAYSLAATSPEEEIARTFLLEGHPDVVVVVLDAAHLERNLFLATQILELRSAVVLALNMTDVARSAGIELDYEALSRLTQAPVVPVTARTGEGMDDLLDTVVALGARATA